MLYYNSYHIYMKISRYYLRLQNHVQILWEQKLVFCLLIGQYPLMVQRRSQAERTAETRGRVLDAAVETSKGFVQRNADRPIIVVLSTLGIDYSNMDDRTALDRLVDAGVVLHTVVLLHPTASAGSGQTAGALGPGSFLDQGLGPSPFEFQNIERDRFLNAGPSTTGGRRHDLLLSASTEQALRRLAAQIRGQYLVEYSRPATLIPPERVDVNVRQDGLDARGVPVKTGNALND